MTMCKYLVNFLLLIILDGDLLYAKIIEGELITKEVRLNWSQLYINDETNDIKWINFDWYMIPICKR